MITTENDAGKWAVLKALNEGRELEQKQTSGQWLTAGIRGASSSITLIQKIEEGNIYRIREIKADFGMIYRNRRTGKYYMYIDVQPNGLTLLKRIDDTNDMMIVSTSIFNVDYEYNGIYFNPNMWSLTNHFIESEES